MCPSLSHTCRPLWTTTTHRVGSLSPDRRTSSSSKKPGGSIPSKSSQAPRSKRANSKVSNGGTASPATLPKTASSSTPAPPHAANTTSPSVRGMRCEKQSGTLLSYSSRRICQQHRRAGFLVSTSSWPLISSLTFLPLPIIRHYNFAARTVICPANSVTNAFRLVTSESSSYLPVRIDLRGERITHAEV